jgi:PAS domain S-box-containing protein
VATGVIEAQPAVERTAARARLAHAVRFVAVVGVYYGAGKLGLDLSVAHGVITPVWAPTGIALVALVLFGPRLWPAVLLAAFLANATSGASIPVALAISVGNTLEAVVGSVLLRRARFRPTLDSVRDVLALAILGAVVSTAVSATNGVTALWVAHDLSNSYGSSWFLWWVGDSMGDLIVAPLLFVLATVPLRRVLRLEAAALLALFVGLSCFVFLAGYWRYPHLLFPLYIWATLRFGQLGASTGSFVVAAIAVAGAVGGHTPLAHASGTNVVLILEGLLAGVAISVLLLGAVLAERARAEGDLAEAQRLAHIGNWQWEIDTGRISWSDELYRLYGLDPSGAPIDYATYIGLIHPEDRAFAQSVIADARENGRPFAFQHRVVLPDGRTRWLQGRGRVVEDADGHAVRMLGTSQDVTERKQVDELRDTILAAVSHELRTPLTSIVGFALTLKERTLDAAVRTSLLDTMVGQAQKLERMLAELLDLDRLRHGLVRPAFVETDVAQLVRRVVAEHADTAHPIELHAETATASVDPAKVERIVDNLVANAIRHTPPQTTIGVGVAPADGGIVIAVDDGGDGVSTNERSTIFEPFARGEASASVPGTGIGLALVAQFAALHGGRAWVEDSPRGGAGFRVFLPRRPAG